MYCIFSEHLFLRTPLDGCLWFVKFFSNSMQDSEHPAKYGLDKCFSFLPSSLISLFSANFMWMFSVNAYNKNCFFLCKQFHTFINQPFHSHLTASNCCSWRHFLRTSSTRLQRNNFSSSKTSWRRLEDVLKKVLKTSRKTFWRTSSRTKNCYAEDVLKTSWRNDLKPSSGCLLEKQKVYWGYLHLTNLNMYLTNLYSEICIWRNYGKSKRL